MTANELRDALIEIDSDDPVIFAVADQWYDIVDVRYDEDRVLLGHRPLL